MTPSYIILYMNTVQMEEREKLALHFRSFDFFCGGEKAAAHNNNGWWSFTPFRSWFMPPDQVAAAFYPLQFIDIFARFRWKERKKEKGLFSLSFLPCSSPRRAPITPERAFLPSRPFLFSFSLSGGSRPTDLGSPAAEKGPKLERTKIDTVRERRSSWCMCRTWHTDRRL